MAVVGGGGKSTLCFELATALRKIGQRVISSTTTKVRQEEAKAHPRLVLLAGASDVKAINKGLDDAGNVFLGHRFLENGKVDGIEPTMADDLFRTSGADHLVIEADGAAGRPLKSPAVHEPVIPASATMVLAVLGLSALFKPMGPDLVFRPALFGELTGLKEGDIMDPVTLVRVFDERAGLFKNAPASARRVAFLNQLDTLGDRQGAFEFGGRLLSKMTFMERVVLGSLKTGEFMRIS